MNNYMYNTIYNTWVLEKILKHAITLAKESLSQKGPGQCQ